MKLLSFTRGKKKTYLSVKKKSACFKDDSKGKEGKKKKNIQSNLKLKKKSIS